MYKELDILYQLPEFPRILAEMQEKWKAEQEKRNRFYNEVSESVKAEFINGEIIIHSPVTLKHNLISQNLLLLLKIYVYKHKLGLVGIEKLLIRLTRNDYEPDICFFGNEKAAAFTPEQKLFPAPDFIIEIASESTEKFDRGVKLKDYELHCIPEYWIIDTVNETIEQYNLTKDKYQKTIISKDQKLISRIINGFEIPAGAVFNESVCREVLKEII
ncbi:MAG: Uma2 family endonuclease [Bacteroidia bacterium]|nr:Uma2 family endonuclease [Bacteroidia bacterium]